MRALFLLGCLSGCALDVALDTVEQGIGMEPGDDGTGGGCPVWGCGSNTSKTNGIPFIDAHELGLQNAEGFSITALEHQVGGSWVRYRPDVQNAELLARDLTTGAVVLQGVQLEGTRFEMLHVPTGIWYHLTTVSVGEMPMWAQPDPAHLELTPIYRLQWEFMPGQPNLPTQQPQDICGANPDGASGGGPMADFYAVLFEDDRYDVEDLRITGETADWFNIGCAGHALAKQHLLGHTKGAGAILQTTTTFAQRTANLKMITADYCGNGHPFTVPGQPLRWRDENYWYDTIPSATVAGEIEARWGENGAVCLNTPRVDFTYTPLGAQTFVNGVAPLLTTWCRTLPPPCRGTTANMAGEHLLSVNL